MVGLPRRGFADRVLPEGAAWLFARLETALVASSVLASEEEPAELAAAIVEASTRELSPARRSQAARLLRAALDVLRGG